MSRTVRIKRKTSKKVRDGYCQYSSHIVPITITVLIVEIIEHFLQNVVRH